MNESSCVPDACLDAALQDQFPLHIVGVFAPFEPLESAGLRLLMTARGLMIEACNGVQYLRDFLCAEKPQIILPYGELAPLAKIVDDEANATLVQYLHQARADSQENSDHEIVRLIVKAPGQQMRYIDAASSASASYATYDLSQLRDGEEVIADVHSHACGNSYFSEVDNCDDLKFRGPLKLSLVFGNCNLHWMSMTTTYRYVARGKLFTAQES